MKKNYLEPLMEVVEIRTSQYLLSGSAKVTSTTNNAGFSTTVSGGSGDARARGYEDDDDWDF